MSWLGSDAKPSFYTIPEVKAMDKEPLINLLMFGELRTNVSGGLNDYTIPEVEAMDKERLINLLIVGEQTIGNYLLSEFKQQYPEQA